MAAYKEQQRDEAKREREHALGADVKHLAEQLAVAKLEEVKASDYIHPMVWTAAMQTYALACSIAQAGPVTHEVIMNHMFTVLRVSAKTNSFSVASRYDVLARGKWEAKTGLGITSFKLEEYVKTIDDELFKEVLDCCSQHVVPCLMYTLVQAKEPTGGSAKPQPKKEEVCLCGCTFGLACRLYVTTLAQVKPKPQKEQQKQKVYF